jgi:ParB/RepB/Spo0J family partition protein
VLIDQSGSVKSELARGEHKSLQTDRVILQPGPDAEVAVVNQIYRWFVDDNLTESEIAERLNTQGIRTDLGRDWTRATVREVLSNEKYIGNNVYNRRSFKLKKHRVVNGPEMWIKKEGAFEGIVPPELFYTAQGILRARSHRYSDDELIEKLRSLYQQHGYLSGLIIDEAEGMPSAAAYAHRFGSLIRAYQTVGFTPDRDYQYLEVNQFLRRLHPEIVGQTERMIAEVGGAVERDPATDLLTVNREFTVSLVLARCQLLDNGRRRWKVRFDTSLAPDITVAVRLDEMAIKLPGLLPAAAAGFRPAAHPSGRSQRHRVRVLPLRQPGLPVRHGPAHPHTEGRMSQRQRASSFGIADDSARPHRGAQSARAQQPRVRADRRQHPEHRPEKAHHRDPAPGGDGEHYLLICGEGRFKAFKTIGQQEIPAMVMNVDDESAFIMSLTENIARRKFSPLELLVGIEQLRDQGYDKKAIAQKTGLSPEYVQGILYLLKNGEERLLMAVGSGRIPLNAAITIAGAGTDDKSVQAALQEAYESGKLRGSQLIQARRVIERRRTQGRSIGGRMPSRKPNEDVTTSSLVRNYQREVERQKLLVRKAETAQRNLLFIVGALRQLLADENFTNLLRAEGLDTLPQYLADRVWARGSGA